jgi:DNA-binding response OmpR family regulator
MQKGHQIMTTEQRPVTSVLVVDDDPYIVEFMTEVLTAAGCEVRSAHDGEQALQEADTFCPDVVFLDIVIPEQDGWLVCSKLKTTPNSPAIVLITGHPDHKTDRFASFVDADELMKKPFCKEDVLRVLYKLMEHR